MNSADFLDAVRRRHKLTSDYQVGKLTGINPSRISMYRVGRREFDDETCLLFAKALDVGPMYVIANIQAERANKPDLRRVWKAIAKMTKKAKAAALLIAINGLLNLSPAGVSQAQGSSEAAAVNDLYIIRSRGKGKAKGHWRNTVMRALRRLFAAWRTFSQRNRRYCSLRGRCGAHPGALACIAIFACGCAASPDADYQRRARQDEQIDQFLEAERVCNAAGGVMMVKQSATRTRRGPDERIKLAQCVRARQTLKQ